MLEAIALCEEIGGNRMQWTYSDQNRKGDHIWWISDVNKFRSHYPTWDYRFTLRDTIEQLFESYTSGARHQGDARHSLDALHRGVKPADQKAKAAKAAAKTTDGSEAYV
jgi:hypothetical protein